MALKIVSSGTGALTRIPASAGGVRSSPPAQARSAQIVEFATDAIISKDREGQITSWNLGAERLYGYRAEETLEKPLSFLIPEQLKGEEWELLQRVLAGEHIDSYETLRVARDGAIVNVSLTLFALRDGAGEIVGAASIAHDISRQATVKEELSRSEQRYRQILDSTYEGVWQVNLDLVTDYANPSIAKMLGYTVDEMLGRHLSDFLDQERMVGARARIKRRSGDGAGERFEQTYRRKDGSELPVLMSVNSVTDDDQNKVGNLAIVTDLSSQRRAETHLHRTEVFLANLTASMEEGLVTLDADGLIVTVNRAAEYMLGYGAEELHGRTLCASLGCQHSHEQPCTSAICRLTEIGPNTGPLRIDDQAFSCKDGSRLDVDLSAAPLGDQQGVPAGHVVVFRDITERKRASEHARRELEEMSWIGRLQDAMDEDRLLLAAQPIVALATGELSSQELLVRLRDRHGRLVMPSEFLPSAERFGMIGALDRWVMVQAARMAARGHAVNVNLSAQSLGNPELAGVVERMIRDEQADPARITFEITETALTEHLDLASQFTKRIAAVGCTFALDDFGTGYGAFTYLKTLPIKRLKIDIEFVRDLLHNEASEHLVIATVQLARSFGQETVAEGVEDEATLQRLRELGVDYVQGYYLGRPELVTLD